MASAVARWVDSPTSTVPGGARLCRREAVLTRSPATIPCPAAPMVAAASPVRTAARSWSGCPASVMVLTAETRSRAARTARSASSSWATGTPHTAMTASPMNFSTRPAVAAQDVRRGVEVPRQQRRASPPGRDPRPAWWTRPGRRTGPIPAAVRRSPSRLPVAPRRRLRPVCGEPSPATSPVPHSTQNFAPGAFAVPQFGHAALRRAPHSRQNFAPATFSVPQTPQFIAPRPRSCWAGPPGRRSRLDGAGVPRNAAR